jgi:hypothetical protein
MQDLVTSNLECVRLAKDLMLAQEVADLHETRAEQAIDEAAQAGDEDAIDEAVAAVAVAAQANAAEAMAASSWGAHVERVHRLTRSVDELCQDWTRRDAIHR